MQRARFAYVSVFDAPDSPDRAGGGPHSSICALRALTSTHAIIWRRSGPAGRSLRPVSPPFPKGCFSPSTSDRGALGASDWGRRSFYIIRSHASVPIGRASGADNEACSSCAIFPLLSASLVRSILQVDGALETVQTHTSTLRIDATACIAKQNIILACGGLPFASVSRFRNVADVGGCYRFFTRWLACPASTVFDQTVFIL